MINKILIALVFALLMAAGSVQAGGDAARGGELAEDCAGCHGDNGEGDGGDTPAIAGLDEASHIGMLKAYASGEKEDESGMMAMYAEELSEQDMADIAAYYASMK
jgi:cytochrome c553